MEIVYISFEGDRYKRTVISEIKENLKEEAVVAQKIIENFGILKLKEIVKGNATRYTVISEDGRVIFDSKKAGQEYNMENHKYRDEVKNAESGKVGISIKKSSSIGGEYIYAAIPIKDGFIIRTAREYRPILENSKSFVFTYLLYALLFNIIVYILYLKITLKYYNSRIRDMKVILEKGEKAREIYLEEESELKNFWRVIKRWQNENIKNVEKLKWEMEKLKEVISSVDMGIIVINEDGEIVINNQESEIIMDKEIENNRYYEKIKYIELIKYINRVYEMKINKKEEIYFSEIKRYYIIEGKYLESINFFIITMKNITKEKELSEIQKRFITNISHELKTPLTNIKGYMSAIKDENEEAVRANFIGVINRNVDKIENMIRDFLNMSKLESSRVINRYPCQIAKLIENVQNSLDGIINKKDAEIRYSINTKKIDGYLTIDRDKISTVLKNLIENSIIYNNNKPEIDIIVTEEEKEYCFTIQDNGIGIAKDELENIFERFYRVDKARSSNVAGTGLGLAIVDEIIKIYGGKLEVISTENVGTKFTFRIPKN